MKITSVDIAAFGRFKDYHLTLGPGMTVLFAGNEGGKTTLLTFIRMMFYGSTGRSAEVEKNLRKKYRPWDGELMAGSISFEADGKNYRLEREFRSSNSTDKITLVDLDTGARESLYGGDAPGERFFGLTDAAALRVVFLGEGSDEKGSAADGELNSRLSNLSSTGEEDVNFEAVILRLQKAKESLFSKRGTKGLGCDAEAGLREVTASLEAALATEKQVAEMELTLAEKETELRHLGEESSRRFELMKNANKLKKLRLAERYLDALKTADELKLRLKLKNGLTADKGFVSRLEELIKEAAAAERRVATADAMLCGKQAELARLRSPGDEIPATDTEAEEAEISEIDRKAAELSQKAEEAKSLAGSVKPTKKIRPILCILGGVAAAAGGVGTAFTPWAAILIVLGALLALSGVIFRATVPADTGQLSDEAEAYTAELAALLCRKQALIEQINAVRQNVIKTETDRVLREEKQREIDESEEALADAKDALLDAEDAVSEFIGQLEAVPSGAAAEILSSLKEDTDGLDALLKRLPILQKEADCADRTEAEERVKRLGADPSLKDIPDIPDSGTELQAGFKATAALKGEVAALKARIEAVTEGIEPVAVLSRRKAELEERVAAYKSYCESVDIAASALEESFRTLRRTYSGELNEKTAEIFRGLTGGRYKSVTVSKDFEVLAEPEYCFGSKQSEFLSLGTRRQLYLALRLALSGLIDGSLPLMSDDPLDSYDDLRAETALKFLKAYSAGRQTVMLTCHTALCEMARELDIDIKEI